MFENDPRGRLTAPFGALEYKLGKGPGVRTILYFNLICRADYTLPFSFFAFFGGVACALFGQRTTRDIWYTWSSFVICIPTETCLPIAPRDPIDTLELTNWRIFNRTWSSPGIGDWSRFFSDDHIRHAMTSAEFVLRVHLPSVPPSPFFFSVFQRVLAH